LSLIEKTGLVGCKSKKKLTTKDHSQIPSGRCTTLPCVTAGTPGTGGTLFSDKVANVSRILYDVYELDCAIGIAVDTGLRLMPVRV